MRRGLQLLGGLVVAGIGSALVFAPFASLAVLVLCVAAGLVALALTDFAAARHSPIRWPHLLSGGVWLAAAVAVLAWPGITIAGLALALAVSLLVSAVANVAAYVRRTAPQPVVSLLFGVASLAAGAVLFAWPDITVFVVAIAFGARVALLGVSVLITAVRGRRGPSRAGMPPWQRRVRAGTAVAAALVSIMLVVASTAAYMRAPRPDDFYAAPESVSSAPGELLRTEEFSRAVPLSARAWRILYTTTRDDGEPALASAIVVAPRDASAGPRPVIAWAHGTTGVASKCAPSLLEDPFKAGATPALNHVIDNGWVMVATDYVGLGTEQPHPYVIGQGEGRSVLDSVRAAQQMTEVELADSTVVWGHSQGGHAALWTGILAPKYAADANVKAVAALAPASDLTGLAGNLEELPGGALFGSFIIESYAAVYDDVNFSDYVRPAARIPVREMAARCLAEPAVFVSGLESLLFDRSPWRRDPGTGPLGTRLEHNSPRDPITVPLLLGQGGADPLILPGVQTQFAGRQCDAGTSVDYRVYDGKDHLSVVADDSPLIPDLLQWTAERFAGEPAADNCP